MQTHDIPEQPLLRRLERILIYQPASPRSTQQREQVAIHTVVTSDSPGQHQQQSQHPDDGVNAYRTCQYEVQVHEYSEEGRNTRQHSKDQGQVYQPLSPVVSLDASNAGFSHQHKAQDWSVNRLVVGSRRTFVRGLQTPMSAAH